MNYGEALKMWREIKEYIVSTFYEVDSSHYSHKMGIKEIQWRIKLMKVCVVDITEYSNKS